MPKITTLELEIKQTITNSRSTALEKLATNLNALKTSVSGIEKDLGSVVGAFKAFSGSLENGNTMAANIKKCGAAIKKLIEDSKGADTAATGMAKIADQLERISNASGNASGIKSALSDINKAAATNDARTKPAVDTGKGTTHITAKDLVTEADKIADTKTELKEATKASASFGFSLSKAVESGGKLVNAGWDKLKSKISGLLGPISNLLHSFGRITMYRGLRTAIKAITQGFSQGIEHLYKWSALVGNSFKQSMDSIATSAHYLRDSLGAMASPLLDALAPALEILVDKFVSLLNIANQFFAALTGKTTWRKAVRTPTEWAKATDDATDSTKKATEAQKKLNKALMDFDEIHLLTTTTTKGSNPKSPSASGNDSGIDATHFEEVPIASWIQDIKDAIANGDWYGAGKMLADKLNGIIDDWDAEAWGRKLGQKIQHGLEFYLGFMQNFHWDTLGGKFADFLNGMIDEINPNDLGEAIVAKFNAAIDLLSGFTKRFNWDAAGKWLADVLVSAFTGLKWKTLGELIGNLAGGILSFLKAGLDELLNRKGEVMDAIGDFFSGLGWSGLKNVVELSAIVLGFKLLFGAVFGDSGLINYVKEKASGFVSSIGTSIKGYLSGLGATMGTTSIGAVTIIGSVVMGACTLKDWIESCREKGLLKGTLSTFGGEDGAWYHAILGGGESIGTVGQATIKLFLDLDDQGGVAAFKDKLDAVLEKVKAILRALGFKLPEDDNLPTSNTPVVSQSTPGAQFDPTTGEYFVSSQTGKIREDIDYINSHPANVTVTDVDNGLATGAANAGALVSKAGLGGLKGDYPTKVSAADLGAAKGNATALVGKAGLGGLAKTYSSKVSITNLSGAASDVDKLLQMGKLKKSYTTDLIFRTSVTTAKSGSTGGTTKSLLTKSQLVKVLSAYAQGGFPSDDLTQGSLFVAGEMPGQAEMVGNINGKTGVASGKEITGIGDAVRETGANEAALLREQNQLLRQILAKSGSVTLAPSAAAGRWVSQSQAAYARATGV